MSLLLFMTATAAAVPPTQFTQDEQRRMLAEFAACVVQRRPRIAASVLLNDRYFDDLLNPDCMPELAPNVSLYARPVLLRYALADALVRRDSSPTLRDLSAIPPLPHDHVARSYPEGDRNLAAISTAVSQYGECVVRTSPAESERLIRSAVTTPEEDSAFAALGPALSACLFKGQTGTFSREVLRGTVALNYYRLAKAPRVAPLEVAR